MYEEKLKTLGLKDDEVRAFVFLLENGPTPAGLIAKKTNVKRVSLYGHLKNLVGLGLITQSEKNGVKIFYPAELDKVESVFENRIKEIKSAKESIEVMMLGLKNKKGWQPPKFQIFENAKELQNFIRDIFLYRNIKTQSYWPIKSIIEILGDTYFSELNKERIRRQIYVDAIWPEKQKVDMEKYPFMGSGKEFFREIRIAPKNVEFSMGYWIYENKVVFISSRKSNFGFIVESEEFVEMLRSQWQVVWQISKPLKVSTQKSQKLYENMMQDKWK